MILEQLNVHSLETYIATVNQIPMLSLEEEINLSRRLKLQGDLEAAHKLVTSHLRMVVSIARGFLGYGLPHADLIQEGNIGLMKAVKKFDVDQGARLCTYAVYWIKSAIHEYILKNWRLVKIVTTKAHRKLFFNLRSLKDRYETLSPIEVKKLAQDLNVKQEEVVEMEKRFGANEASLDALVEGDNEAHSYPIKELACWNEEPTKILEAKAYDRLQSSGLSHALSVLDPRSRRIIEARWLANDDGSGATLHELADEFKVSAERIRQIESAALKKMKTILTNFK